MGRRRIDETFDLQSRHRRQLQVPPTPSPEIDRAVKAARAIRVGPWHTMTPSDGRILWKLADLLRRIWIKFARIESLDNGKPLAVARVAVPLAVDLFRYMAGWARKFA